MSLIRKFFKRDIVKEALIAIVAAILGGIVASEWTKYNIEDDYFSIQGKIVSYTNEDESFMDCSVFRASRPDIVSITDDNGYFSFLIKNPEVGVGFLRDTFYISYLDKILKKEFIEYNSKTDLLIIRVNKEL